MEFKNKVKMSLMNWENFKDDDNISLSFAKITFLSTRPNSHKHIYTEDVLKKYAPSYLGKFVVAEYDEETDDCTTHTDDKLKIVGYIPSNQKVLFDYDKDDYLQASVDVVISKIYATNVYEVFRKTPKKAVSVEQLVGFTEETKNNIDGVTDKVISGFEGIGITILGEAFNPSIPNANITIDKMSTKQYEAEYVKYVDTNSVKKDDVNMSEILNKLNDIEEKINKEEKMSKKDENNKLDIVKYAVSIGDELWGRIYKVMRGKYPKEYDGWIGCQYYIKGIYEEGQEKFVIVADCDDDKMFKIMFTLSDAEFELSDELIEVVKDFKEINEMSMFSKEDFEKYEEEIVNLETKKEEEKVEIDNEEKMSELELKLEEAEKKIIKYEAELKELSEFKEKIEMSKCKKVVEETLSIAKKVIEEDKYAELVEQGEKCTYSDVNNWSEKVLASVSKLAITKMEEFKNSEKDNGIQDFGLPLDTEQSEKCIYD